MLLICQHGRWVSLKTMGDGGSVGLACDQQAKEACTAGTNGKSMRKLKLQGEKGTPVGDVVPMAKLDRPDELLRMTHTELCHCLLRITNGLLIGRQRRTDGASWGVRQCATTGCQTHATALQPHRSGGGFVYSESRTR